MKLIRSSVSMLILLATAASSFGAAFTAGNIVVERIGGGGTLSSSATNIFLDEFSPAGTLVQTIALPGTSGSGNTPFPVTDNGTSSADGFMSRSADGQVLVIPGYTNVVGATTPASLSQSKTIAIVKYDGTVDTRTMFSGVLANQAIRSATSSDGTNIWFCGANAIGFVTNFQQSAATSLNSLNSRCVTVAGNQLYASAGSGTNRLVTVGTGLPMTAGQAIGNIPGMYQSGGGPEQFAFLDLNAGVSGLDTLYMADTFGIVKWSLVGGLWVSNATINTGTSTTYSGLCASNDAAGVVTIYAILGAPASSTGGGSLQRLIDTNGYNAGIAGVTTTTVANAGSSPTTGTGTVFRGVAFAPVQIASGGPSINFSASSTTNQTEGNGPVTVSVRLSIEGTGSVQITSVGSADIGNDFTLSATNFDFTAGNSTQTLTITISDDAAIEATETVSLNLANPTGGTLASPTNFSFTLLDNDQSAIQFDAASAADTSEGGGPVTVNVQISSSADATVQVAAAGSAVLGTDYSLSSTQIVFTSGGATSQTLTVTMTDDVVPETAESVQLSLANPSGAGLLLQTNFAFNILDNEPAVRFAVSSATTGESSGTVDVVVYKTSTNNTVTGNLTIGGTAAQGGGADYTIAATNFTLDGATTSATVTITLVNDSVSEGDETVTLTLAGIAAASTTTPSAFTLTIIDDDPAAPLYAGDIALIGRINNTAPDTFALVALTNLSAGQVIYFTDNGWDSAGGMFRGAAASGKGNEDIMKLTINSNLAAGTIIQAYDVSNPAWSWVATNSAIPGTNSTFNALNYAQAGDQTCVFTAPRNSPLQNPTTHIFVLDDTHGFEDATTTAFGNEPPGLSSNAYTALSFDFTNLTYAALNMTGASTQSLTKAQWLAYIADVANWTTGASGSLPSGTISVVNPGAPPPTPYETWMAANGIGAGQETGDADTDGYLNLLEYATGAQPTNASSGAQMNAQAGVVPMKFVFSRNTNAVDVTLVVEAANDVTNDVPWFGIATNINGSWGAATNVSETIGGSPVTVTVTDTEAAATNRYMRLRVTKP